MGPGRARRAERERERGGQVSQTIVWLQDSNRECKKKNLSKRSSFTTLSSSLVHSRFSEPGSRGVGGGGGGGEATVRAKSSAQSAAIQESHRNSRTGEQSAGPGPESQVAKRGHGSREWPSAARPRESAAKVVSRPAPSGKSSSWRWPLPSACLGRLRRCLRRSVTPPCFRRGGRCRPCGPSRQAGADAAAAAEAAAGRASEPPRLAPPPPLEGLRCHAPLLPPLEPLATAAGAASHIGKGARPRRRRGEQSVKERERQDHHLGYILQSRGERREKEMKEGAGTAPGERSMHRGQIDEHEKHTRARTHTAREKQNEPGDQKKVKGESGGMRLICRGWYRSGFSKISHRLGASYSEL